ncbi:MAG: exodeoxyribonuclease VII small subunit [Lachnospiraceae bacterium]|nr:exodeoxyribonuclease VII small subunit [Lachnospiraceae bacterium]
MAEKDNIDVEEAFKNIEGIIERLQDPKLPLAESIELYSKGVGLVDACRSSLSGIEERIKEIEAKRG